MPNFLIHSVSGVEAGPVLARLQPNPPPHHRHPGHLCPDKRSYSLGSAYPWRQDFHFHLHNLLPSVISVSLFLLSKRKMILTQSPGHDSILIVFSNTEQAHVSYLVNISRTPPITGVGPPMASRAGTRRHSTTTPGPLPDRPTSLNQKRELNPTHIILIRSIKRKSPHFRLCLRDRN